MKQDILLTVEQIVELFGVSSATVRSWIAKELIKPVRREGQGRSGRMYFEKGAVAVLVYGICPTCGESFKRSTLKQGFCSRLCRDRHRSRSA